MRSVKAAFGFSLVVLAAAADMIWFGQGIFKTQATSVTVGEVVEEPVDLIAVLTGGQGRLREALNAFRMGGAQRLLISGSEPGVTLETILAANGASDLPEELKSRIVLDEDSRRTRDNARQIRKLCEQKDCKTLLVVTSAYHGHRALKLIEAELLRSPALQIAIRPIFVDSPNFPRDRWYKTLLGWRLFLSEYFKSRFFFVEQIFS